MPLSAEQENLLTQFATALVNQEAARVIVPAQEASTGFWFGGGNMVVSPDGDLYTVGRYRNFGDSRTGVAVGTRGLELAIFKSTNGGESFEKALSWSKSDLDVGDETVLSIEGSALSWNESGIELYVSTEKSNRPYPTEFESFLKPGTGVWTIDRLRADTIEGLKSAKVEPFLECGDPSFVHVKDPFVYEASESESVVLFCSHPFCWSSSNTGFIDSSKTMDPVYEFFPRGPAWDVAMTRGTALFDVPMLGEFADLDVTLVFYDGGECVRDLDAHKSAVDRPRGYSCEELGGLGYIVDGEIGNIQRLSKYAPLFVSPFGTGCSRYVDVVATEERIYATWQQSQDDLSQPLVMNSLAMADVAQMLELPS